LPGRRVLPVCAFAIGTNNRMADHDSNLIHAALVARSSIRAYLNEPVPMTVVRRILASAATAPSGNNTQPWLIDVVTGGAKRRLSEAILDQRAGDTAEPKPEYPYYPDAWPEPYLSRRREIGWALYKLIGVKRGDVKGSREHHNRNFVFFGAPVGIILSVDRRLGHGAYIDAGLFLEALAIAAQSEGLGTCMQASFAPYAETIRRELGRDSGCKILCGVALGYPDPEAPINTLRPGRVPVETFARFHNA